MLKNAALISMAASLALLGGCAASSGGTGLLQLNAPNGALYYRVKCNGSEQECLAKANQACGGPYQVITSESHSGGLLADLMPGPVMWYSMHFQCGPSDGAIPTFRHNGPTFAEAWENYQDRAVELERIRQANRPVQTICTTSIGGTVTCTTQ